MQVIELAKKFDVSADTIRHYARVGILKPVKDSANGYRRFTVDDERRLHFALRARHLGFTLEDLKKIIDYSSSENLPGYAVKDIISSRLKQVEGGMREIILLYEHMQSAIAQWQSASGSEPTGDNIADLIESWGKPEEEELIGNSGFTQSE